MEPFQNPHIIHDNGMCIMLHDIYVIKYFFGHIIRWKISDGTYYK